MKRIILTLIFLFFLIPIAECDYYEDVYDNLNNDTNIHVLNVLILNTTDNSISFNYSAGGDYLIPENTTEYTNYGSSLVFQKINETRIYGYMVPKNADHYLYKDYGVDYITDFKAQCDIRFLNYQSSGLGSFIKFTNDLDEDVGNQDAIIVRAFHSLNTDYDYSIGLWTKKNGVTYNSVWYYSGINTPFSRYLDLYRVGGNVWLEIYDDVDRTNLVTNLTATTDSNLNFRYAYWGSSIDVGESSRLLYWYCDNFKFRSGGDTIGYFYSKDYLNITSNYATALLINTTIDSGNSIVIEVSNNNSTWIEPNNNYLSDGYNAINLEYLNYSTLYIRGNFTRPVGAGICEIESMKIIYDSVCSGTTSSNISWWLPLTFILVPSIIVIAVALNKR